MPKHSLIEETFLKYRDKMGCSNVMYIWTFDMVGHLIIILERPVPCNESFSECLSIEYKILIEN